ncbi:Palmitoyltransferase PFA4 like protein [Verticillium longisporum]|nr:Palmitoyltransferase PFA4 like protein [Verticillium longisporum]
MLDEDGEDGMHLNHAAGGAAWTNSDGERLYDYGVDEDAENTEVDLRHTIVGEADDDVPLAELLRRRKIRRKDGEE